MADFAINCCVYSGIILAYLAFVAIWEWWT